MQISSPRDAHLVLALQRLEEDEVQHLEEKEQMIMKNGELATIMQQQEEYKFAEIDGERISGHDINSDRGGFASCSECPFLVPFSSVFHITKLGRRLNSNNLGNGQYFFLHRSFTPSTSSIQSHQKSPLWKQVISGIWNVFSTTFFFVPHFVLLIVNKLIAYYLFLYTISSIIFQYLCF